MRLSPGRYKIGRMLHHLHPHATQLSRTLVLSVTGSSPRLPTSVAVASLPVASRLWRNRCFDVLPQVLVGGRADAAEALLEQEDDVRARSQVPHGVGGRLVVVQPAHTPARVATDVSAAC